MTKETASTLLTQIFNTYGNIMTANYKDGVIKEAFEMAIKALKSDTPQTESYYTDATHFGKAKGESTTTNTADTPQTDCETCKHYNPHHEAIACERCLDGKYSRYEPQTEPVGCVKDWSSNCTSCERYFSCDYLSGRHTDCGWGEPR